MFADKNISNYKINMNTNLKMNTNTNLKMNTNTNLKMNMKMNMKMNPNHSEKTFYFDFDPGRVRSYRYPDPDNDGYIESTYYDKNNRYFDLGYQKLKQLHLNLYPEFAYLKILFVDHNNLVLLPEPKYLPNLEELNCSVNQLKAIPFYPKLTFLNISHNMIDCCNQYDNSKLTYLDCSYNNGFVLDFYMPVCIHLYITNCNLEFIDLDFVPILQFLDCESNNLKYIIGESDLIEINLARNKIESLYIWPKLTFLTADDNYITVLPTFPNLSTVNICYNKLTSIDDQPNLKKFYASYNQIKCIGSMPLLEIVDLSHNAIKQFVIPNNIKYLSIQFNPLTDLSIGSVALTSIKELQVNFNTYRSISKQCLKNIDRINIQINEKELKRLVENYLDDIFVAPLAEYIYKLFCTIEFKDHKLTLYKLASQIYLKYFAKDNVKSLDEIVLTEEFQRILYNITKFYYRAIVITFYFNGFF